ncbi:MAG: class I SAM-dependent methyltransferase [Thermoflexibacteraceae bacterium]|jgi:ubiquinone/menaquinone biosynthesis methyltransferase
MEKFYESQYIKKLFDDMSSTYELMNQITSFGFSEMWRWQCVHKLKLRKGAVVADLMTGMGESWRYLIPKIGEKGKIIAVDFSEGMLKFAHQRKDKVKYARYEIDIRQENIFESTVAESSVDAVVSTYGLKTFDEKQLEQLALTIKKILKNGGQFSLVEVSKPSFAPLKIFYLFYLQNVIPILGRLFLGNPDTYRMLGIYTLAFGNCEVARQQFEKAGLPCQTFSLFFGCATGIYGVVEK